MGTGQRRADDSRNLAVYGTLRPGLGPGAVSRDLHAMLVYRGPCSIGGVLWDLGAYPGLVCGGGTVVGELFYISDERALEVADRYEGFDPERPRESLFVRKVVTLVEPRVGAWVYFYSRPVRRPVVVRSGDWASRGGPVGGRSWP